MSRRVTARGRVEGADAFAQSVRALGDRLGPIRIKVQQARDDGFLRLLLDSLDEELHYALDFRHESWEAAEISARLDERAIARVGSCEGAGAFRYLRLREPQYDDDAIRTLATRLEPLLAGGIDVYSYFRHDEEPTAPLFAERLLGFFPDRN